MEVLVPISVALAGAGLLGALERWQRPGRPVQSVELRFGADVTTEAALALIASIAGLPRGAVVWLDVLADQHGIRHLLHAEQSIVDTLRSQWRGVLPSLRADEVERAIPTTWSRGAVLRESGQHPVLRSDASEESARALLGAMQPLGHSEAVLWRWVLGPARGPRLPYPPSRRGTRPETMLADLLAGESPRLDHLRVVRGKYAGPVLAGVGLVAVRAAHPKRAAHLLSRVVSVARARRSAYGALVVRRRGARRIARLLDRGGLPGSDRYAPAELAGLLGLPIGAPQVAGLTLGTAPVRLPSARIPHTGRVLAASTWPGLDRRLAQPVVGGLSHTVVCGPTGVGKSVLIGNLLIGDLHAGRGCLLVDGKGDLAADLLARIPAHRLDDVIVLEPGRGGPVPGLRVFGGTDRESAELTADVILGIFSDLFADSWGPLSARWLRAGLLLLAHDQAATLADFPFVFSHDAFRRRLLERVTDPLTRSTWASFEAMSPAERAHQLAAPLLKAEEILGRRVVRGVLAQSHPKLDMAEVLRRGRIVIVSLSPGTVGSPVARLIGALTLHAFFSAVRTRAALRPEARRAFFTAVDEPALLNDIPVPLEGLFELARGMGCGMLLSAQSLTQLPSHLRAAVLTNAATVIAFRQGADDARLLARELPGVPAEGLQHLGRFEIVARIGLGPGEVTPPVSGRTYPLAQASSDPDAVRRASAERYGADPAEVDRALAARHQVHESDERPVGRAKRSP